MFNFTIAMLISEPFGYFRILAAIFLLILWIFWLPMLNAEGFNRGCIATHTYIIVICVFMLCFTLLLSTSLLTLFVALEGLSFCGYILTASRVTLRVMLVGFLYTMLGSIATVCFALAIAVLVGFSGSMSYTVISNVLESLHFIDNGTSALVYFAVVAIICIFLFKLAAAPFHLWVPGVYSDAPVAIAALLGGPVRFSIFASFMYFLLACCYPVFYIVCQPVLLCSALVSLVLGFLGGVRQTRIRSLLAYSSIFHTGYILLGLAFLANEYLFNLLACLAYLFIYALTFIGFFIGLSLVDRNASDRQPIVYLADLSLLRVRSFLCTACFVIFFFSLLGLPPFAGFFAKAWIFYVLVVSNHIELLALLVFLTVGSAYYYLRVIYLSVFGSEVPNRPWARIVELAKVHVEQSSWSRISAIAVASTVFLSLFANIDNCGLLPLINAFSPILWLLYVVSSLLFTRLFGYPYRNDTLPLLFVRSARTIFFLTSYMCFVCVALIFLSSFFFSAYGL